MRSLQPVSIELACTSGARPDIPDSTLTADDSIFGRINAKHTKVLGPWPLILDVTDTTKGTPKTDHCDSGAVGWSALE